LAGHLSLHRDKYSELGLDSQPSPPKLFTRAVPINAPMPRIRSISPKRKKFHMNRLPTTMVSVACALFFMAGSAGGSRADSKPDPAAPVAVNDEEPRSKLCRESSAHAVLVAVFRESGWSHEHALVYSNNAFARLGIESYSISEAPPAPGGNPIPGHALLSPMSDVHAVLVNVFLESGWSRAEAIAHTDYCLEKAGLPAALNEDPCQVWEVDIEYCEGEVTKHFKGYMHTQCKEQLWPPSLPAPCALPQCQPPNVFWFTLNTTLACSDRLFVGCVRVHFVIQTEVRDCDSVLGCSCFVENSCDDIAEIECCPPRTVIGGGGCPGCPCDD